MPDTQAKVSSPLQTGAKLLRRLLVLFAVATAFTWVLNHSSTAVKSDAPPAGFAQGKLHGALMPGALPHLLLGEDVAIYAIHNSGRQYKLGYTVGVNGCGALFFGIFFWRVNRWMKRRQGPGQVDASDTPGTNAAGPHPGGVPSPLQVARGVPTAPRGLQPEFGGTERVKRAGKR